MGNCHRAETLLIVCFKMLKDTVLALVNKIAREKGIRFQKGGGTSHIAKMVQEYEANFNFFVEDILTTKFSKFKFYEHLCLVYIRAKVLVVSHVSVKA